MNFAIYGDKFPFETIQKLLSKIRITHYISDLENDMPFLESVNFFEFRRLITSGNLQGVILNVDLKEAKKILKKFKLYSIPNVCIYSALPLRPLYVLDSNKSYMSNAECNLIDSCNLNCSGCAHYANLFDETNFYRLEIFKRDLKALAEKVDLMILNLLGGEPLMLKNLADYLNIARDYFPQTSIRLLTNGLLIPAMSQKFFRALRDNEVILDISVYTPTKKILPQIKEILIKNDIACFLREGIEEFNAFLSLRGGHNPIKSRLVCSSYGCRFFRNGKMYKCPIDALSYKLVEKFGLKDFPKSTGINISAPNFISLLEELDGDVECCYWCNETARKIQWKTSHKPTLDEWLANPMETLNICNFKD